MIIQSFFCPHPTLLALEGSNIIFYVCLGGASELSSQPPLPSLFHIVAFSPLMAIIIRLDSRC
jgi:hypothetical protein